MDFHQPLTSTEFVDRYNLLKPLADGAVRSLSAVATATGDVVMVHYLIGSNEENAAILAALERLPPADGKKIIAAFVIESNHVVVTHFLSGFTSLVDWLSHHDALFSTELHAAAGESAEPPTAPASATDTSGAATPAPSSKPPGEFTRLFGAGQSAEPRPTMENGIPPAATQVPAKSEAGEFTRLFGAYQEPATAPPATPEAPPARPPRPPTHTPPPAPPRRPPAPPPVPPAAPPPRPATPTPPPPPAPPLPPPVPPVRGSGDGRATGVFGAGAPPVPPPPPSAVVPPIAPPLGRDGAAARPTVQPNAPATPPPPRPPAVVPVPGVAPIVPQAPAPLPPPIAQTPPPPAPAPLAGASAQGEYTRLIANATPATSPAVHPATAPVAQPQPTGAPPSTTIPTEAPKAPSYLPLIVTLNVVVLAAIGLVLYFVLRR